MTSKNHLPSRETKAFWIQEQADIGYPEHTERGGKWLLFVKSEEVDGWWNKIRESLLKGHLGSTIKAATARPNPNATSSEIKVICVYSYDADDKEDVMRIRKALREIGVTWRIPYKLDEDTFLGRYRKKGDRRISAYYE